MATAITCALVFLGFAAWGLSPDKHRDGTPVTGKYPLSVDPHGRPTSPELRGDTGERR